MLSWLLIVCLGLPVRPVRVSALPVLDIENGGLTSSLGVVGTDLGNSALRAKCGVRRLLGG